MSNQKGFVSSIVLIIVLAIVIGGGVTWYLVSRPEINSNANLAPALNSSNNVNAADLINWQTFQNATYNFQIKFPSNWFYLPDAMTGPPAPAMTFFSTRADTTPDYANLNIFVSDLMGETLDSWSEIDNLVTDGYIKTDTNIDGEEAVRLERRTLNTDNGATIYVVKDGYMYRIVTGATNQALFTANEDILETMIDSFEFTDPLVADFEQTGVLTQPVTAETTNPWHLLQEEAGSPAIDTTLVFDYHYVTSKCTVDDTEVDCAEALETESIVAGDQVEVSGVTLGDGSVMVLEMTK
jgi:hypothetical protein